MVRTPFLAEMQSESMDRMNQENANTTLVFCFNYLKTKTNLLFTRGGNKIVLKTQLFFPTVYVCPSIF